VSKETKGRWAVDLVLFIEKIYFR